MARVTVFIPDELLVAAEYAYGETEQPGVSPINRSHLVQTALRYLVESVNRPAQSGRGATEALRAARAAITALEDVEATLTQGRPVRRRVRRYTRPARTAS